MMQTLRACDAIESRPIAKIFFGIVAVVSMCACGGPSFVKDPTTGKIFKVKDTAFERRFFIHEVSDWIEDELAGRRPPLVDETWNAWWVDQIHRKKKYMAGDVDFYVSYIIEARRKAGLPDLRWTRTHLTNR